MSRRFAKVMMMVAVAMGGGFEVASLAQTAGEATLEARLLDYNGSGTKHYTVVWVTTESGAFIKSLRKQGPSSWTSKEWGNHCQVWNNARAGSTVLDGYTSATASSYTGTNSPVVSLWNGRDAGNNLVPDGNYRFWVQYAENSGQGPAYSGGLLWTKGAVASTNTYPNQGANFADLRVRWIPSTPAAVAPMITSASPSSVGTVGVPYPFVCTATGTTPIAFSAQGLPPGLAISAAGAISGTPLQGGTFTGLITASNGTLPDATQAFSVTIGTVLTTIASAQVSGGNVLLVGAGPANGSFTVVTSTNASLAILDWAAVGTGTFDGEGHFSFTSPLEPGLDWRFYSLKVP